MKSPLPINLFLLLCGALCWYLSWRGGEPEDKLLQIVLVFVGAGFIAVPLLEIASGQGLFDLLSSENAFARRLAAAVFALGIVAMCALCVYAIATAGIVLQITGVIGLLLFGIGGVFAIFAYWFAPAANYYNQAVYIAMSEDKSEPPDSDEEADQEFWDEYVSTADDNL